MNTRLEKQVVAYMRYMLACLVMLICNPVLADAGKLNVKDIAGKDRTLAEYTGKNQWIIVMIWQSDCHVCNQEAGNYVAWHEKNRKGIASVLGLTTDGWDNRDLAQEFIDKHKVTFPNVLVTAEQLDAWYVEHVGQHFVGTPSFLVFSPSGKLEAAQVGAVPTDLIDAFLEQNAGKSGS